LGECGAGDGGQHCESEQRLFHCEYLLGLKEIPVAAAAQRVSPQYRNLIGSCTYCTRRAIRLQSIAS
jgi:hypothetical protein